MRFAAAMQVDRREPPFDDLVCFVQGEARIVQSLYGSLPKSQSNL